MYLPFSSADDVVARLRAAEHGSDGNLWMLCIADTHGAHLPALLDACAAAQMRIFGGLFPGLIYGEEVKNSGIVAIPLPASGILGIADLSGNSVHWRSELPAIDDPRLVTSIVLLDSLAENITAFLEDLYNRYGTRLVHYGAGAGYHDLRPQPALFTERGMLGNAALTAIMPLRTTVRVRHGWRRVSGPFVASRTKGRVIQEFNWESAAGFYRRAVVEQNPEFAGRPLFPDINSVYPLCIAKECGEDVLRDPIAETDDDEVIVLSDVSENSVMYLAHGDDDSLIAAASQALDDCGAPDDVESCFISDCFSRVLKLGDTFADELLSASRSLRKFSQVTPEGVLAMGEIATHGGQYLELFNKTFVVALTHRRPGAH